MKRIILFSASMALCMFSFAQNDTTVKTGEHRSYDKYDKEQPKYKLVQLPEKPADNIPYVVQMVDGKVILAGSGRTTVMERDTILDNGSQVLVSGLIKMKNGQNVQMKNGDSLNSTGDWVPVKSTAIRKAGKTAYK